MITETASDIRLLKTKYIIPGLNKKLILRKSLNKKLSDSLDCKLTIVAAPAGYGKTTAVLKWLESISFPSAWLSIDPDDNDPMAFWRYFCAALDSISNNISHDTEYILKSKELFDGNAHISLLIDILSNIDKDFLFVLDDFHLIENSSVIDDLSYFIDYMPRNMHIILISRVEPHLKLAKLGLKENLGWIGINDLCFGTEEVDQYYKLRGYYLQKEDVERIGAYTEGWAAALVAVALSLKDENYRHNVINSFGKCTHYIENYLAEDIYNLWTPDQQDFMEKTSILNRLCGPLCEELTNCDGNKLLVELLEQNSFLVPLDNEGIWYRYHQLFSDFLKKRLLRKDSSSIQKLHLIAGEWFIKNGYLSKAIEHFLNGSHFEKALSLIEAHGEAFVWRAEYANLMLWIEKLPTKYIENSPMIMLFKIMYFIDINDFSKAQKYMDHVTLVTNDGNTLTEAVRVTYLLTKTNFFIRRGELEKCFNTILEAAEHGKNTIKSYDYFELNSYAISMYRSQYYLLMNMPKVSSSGYGIFIKKYRSLIINTPGYAPLIEGEFYYESGMLDKALPKVIVSIDEASIANCAGALVPAMTVMAKIKRAHGDISGAIEIIEECEKKIHEFHKFHWSYILKAFKMHLYIDLNNTEIIDKWFVESRLGVYHNIDKINEYELIIFARILIYKQHYENAQILLNRLLSFSSNEKNPHSLVEILNLLAITAMKNLNEEAAIEYLEKALLTGIEEAYVRSFVDELSPMASLLELYINKHNEDIKLTAYAKNLYNLTNNEVKHLMITADSNTLEKLLTPMEKEVLRYLLNAYSNKEIAEELGITLRTVKAHTGNVYKKLEVKTRAQCIKKLRGFNHFSVLKI